MRDADRAAALAGGAGEEATIRDLLDQARIAGVEILDVPLRVLYGPLPDHLVRLRQQLDETKDNERAHRQMTLDDWFSSKETWA